MIIMNLKNLNYQLEYLYQFILDNNNKWPLHNI